MWCERVGLGEKEALKDYITYFEGTCEFCVGNMGINKYLNEINEKMKHEDINDVETNLYIYYIYGVIQYKLEQLEEAMHSWTKAEGFARKLGNEVFLAKIYSYLSIYYYVNKNKKLTDQYFAQACAIFEKHQLYTEMALHYVNYLWYKRYDPNKSEVSRYLDTAFYYVQMSDSQMDARIYLHLGYIYKTVFNDFIRGIGCLAIARDLCYRYNIVEMESMTLHVLADGYVSLGHSDEAMKIYTQLMYDERYSGITENLKCMILGNMIPCCINSADYEEAEKMLCRMEAYVPDTQINIREQFECMVKWLRAQLYIVTGEHMDKVLGLLGECEKIYARNTHNFQVDAFDYKLKGNYGDYYYACGDWDNARLNYLEQGRIADKYGDHALKETCHRLSRVYEKLGNFKKALEYRKEETSYFEQIKNTNILNSYDILYRKFFKAIQDEQLNSLTRKQEELKEVALSDELTGIYNRQYFDQCGQDGAYVGRYGAIMLDIDDFKQYNDHYGHSQGDACLASVASLLQAEAERGGAELIRYGGEEFLVLIKDAEISDTARLARKMIGRVSKANIRHEHSTVSDYLTVSAGCSAGILDGRESLERLTDLADKAMYEAKSKGKNTVVTSGEE